MERPRILLLCILVGCLEDLRRTRLQDHPSGSMYQRLSVVAVALDTVVSLMCCFHQNNSHNRFVTQQPWNICHRPTTVTAKTASQCSAIAAFLTSTALDSPFRKRLPQAILPPLKKYQNGRKLTPRRSQTKAHRWGPVSTWTVPSGVPRQHLRMACTPPPCISYANVRNYYGPYAHCSLDKGVACAQHIQLPTQTCARAWYGCTLTSAHISKCMQTQDSLGNMKISGSHPCWHKQ